MAFLPVLDLHRILLSSLHI